jgi:hypothetical protein
VLKALEANGRAQQQAPQAPTTQAPTAQGVQEAQARVAA